RVRPVSRAMVRASVNDMRSVFMMSRKVGPVETPAGVSRGSIGSGAPPIAIITESAVPQTGFQKLSTALGVPRNSAAPIPRTDRAAADTASRTHLRCTHWRTWAASLVLTGGSAKTSGLGPTAASRHSADPDSQDRQGGSGHRQQNPSPLHPLAHLGRKPGSYGRLG